MNTSLQALTDKIYNEGVEKANVEAAKILAEANAEAAAIMDKAKVEADKLITIAQENAEELDKNTKSELKLFAGQAVNALKTEITNLLCDQLANESVKAATADKDFMQKMIATLVESMAKDGNVTVEAKDAKALTDYFATNAKGLLDKGVSIAETKGIKTDFAIKPAEGGYKITFGDEELVAYFKEFLRAKLVEMLF